MLYFKTDNEVEEYFNEHPEQLINGSYITIDDNVFIYDNNQFKISIDINHYIIKSLRNIDEKLNKIEKLLIK